MICLVGIVLFVCGLANAGAGCRIILGSNMVVQRGQPVEVWGTSSVNARVEVSLGVERTSTTAAPDGSLQVASKPLAAGVRIC